MGNVARTVKFVARPGQGEALGTLMARGRARRAEVMALLAEPPSRTDLEPLGGVWPTAA